MKQVQTKFIRNYGLECIIQVPLYINVGDASKISQDKLQLISEGSISDILHLINTSYIIPQTE